MSNNSTGKQAIKFENFRLETDNSIQINSGLTILAIGIPIMVLPLINVLSIFNGPPEPTFHPLYFGELSSIMQNILFFLAFSGDTLIVSSITGWAVASFFSAILYGNDGKSGPLYASFILFRLSLGVTLILFPVGLVSEFDLFNVYLIAPILLIILLISLPLILVASIAYRIGLWISPK